MPELTEEQCSDNVIAYGRAMVKIVEGADYLCPDSCRAERLILKIACRLYRKRLRELIVLASADISTEILAAPDNIAGPIGDVNLN